MSRASDLRIAWWLVLATTAWNVIEALIALPAGASVASVALVGFGVDSLIETASAAVVAWRLAVERRGGDPERVEHVERRAARIAGALLLGLAAYLVVDSARRLLGAGARPEESGIGIALTAVSLVLMPLLGWSKLRVARRLGSRALRADAVETITCAWLSLTTLAGLILNAAGGFWFADPLAAIALVPWIVREGLEGLRGETDACCAKD